jgi:hypothetical protein
VRFCNCKIVELSSATPTGDRTRAPARSTMISQQDVGGAVNNNVKITDNELDRMEAYKTWELRVDALENLLEIHAVEQYRMHVATLRARIETLPSALFNSWSYYGRWGAAIAVFGVENGIWTRDELANAMGLHNASTTDRAHADNQEFTVGSRVIVRSERELVPWRQPHVRTPGYVHNCTGTVTARLSDEANQDTAAYSHLLGVTAVPKLRVYRVRFQQRDIWPNVANLHVPDDEIDVEIFEDWLSLATSANTSQEQVEIVRHDDDDDHADCDHDDHAHEQRWTVEYNAASGERAPAPGERFCRALIAVAVAKRVVTEAALAAYVEQKSARTSAPARRLIAHAWCDAAFRAQLLDERQCSSVVEQFLGIDLRHTKLVVVENTAQVHHVIVCTLCSCYPSMLLGRSPQWCKLLDLC